jgi:ribonuclease HI
MRIFTDGACFGNPGPGGWAFVIEPPDYPKSQIQHWRAGRKDETTNNEMELQALFEAMLAVDSLLWYPDILDDIEKGAKPYDVTIVSDSKYVVMGATGKWKTKTHLDLWEAVEAMKKVKWINWDFQWVKAHNGNKLNELVDELAKLSVNIFIPNTI